MVVGAFFSFFLKGYVCLHALIAGDAVYWVGLEGR